MQVVEVGARDGLQSESTSLGVADRIELVERLAACGATRIEVASFVHPRLVPQMAGAEEVVAGLAGRVEASLIGLVLNRRGLQRALTTAVDEVNFVVAASEGYNRHNQNAPVAETMTDIERMLPEAEAGGKKTSVTISVAFGDPYDGEVPTDAVAALAERAAAAGADEIALGDTIGVAVPATVRAMVDVLRRRLGDIPLRCHFHNTRNMGYANAAAAVDAGVDALDAAVGGYGGSPFAAGAGGNIGTEDLVFLLDRSGIASSLDGAALASTASWLSALLGTPVATMAGAAGSFPPE